MLFAVLLAANNVVAVLPMDARPGSLEPAEVAALEEEIRAAATEALTGFTLLDAARTASAPKDPRKALDALNAGAVVFAIAARVDGAPVLAIGVYKAGSSAPAGSMRLSGKNVAELKEGMRAKVAALLRSALGTAPAKPEPSATRQSDPLLALVQEIATDVESLRGLRRKSNLKVLVADERNFSNAQRSRAQRELTSSFLAAERARWRAFDLAPPSADPANILPTVFDEQAAAFYDPGSKQLVVRKDATVGDSLRLTLAHEIEHALQQQNFGFPDTSAYPEDDVRLARLALYEGDAMAAMTAYGARRARKHVKAAIINAAAVLKAAEPEVLLRTGGYSSALLKAPAVLREEVALRYAAGFALVAEVYRRGGFALVDRMFASPPASTHQVLHPEAYLAGQAPMAISTPSAPRGTRAIASGRLGEFGARQLLSACVDKSVAADATAHWVGDAYVVVEGSRRALSLLWISAWSAGTSEAVSNLVRLQSPCWQQSASAGGMGAAARVRTGGDFVGIARGAVDLEAAAASALSARTAPAKTTPPFGEMPASPGPTRIEEGHFTSAWLALEGAVPEGYQSDPGNPSAEVSIKRLGVAGGAASLSLVGEPLSGDALETFFEKAAAQIGAQQGGHPSLVGKAQRTLADASAEERTWKIEGAGVQLHIEVGAFCGGKGSLAFVSIESSDAAKAALERFASSIKSTGTAPACSELE